MNNEHFLEDNEINNLAFEGIVKSYKKMKKIENSDEIIENEELKEDNDFLNRRVDSYRFRNAQLRRELHDIKEMSMFEFGNKYCNDSELEEAGHQLARSLGVGQ